MTIQPTEKATPTGPTPAQKDKYHGPTAVSPAPVLTMAEYQKRAQKTAIYPTAGKSHPNGINYTVLGLLGEAGELANDWKKAVRDGDYALAKEKMRFELGDVLWYVALLANELGMDLNQVANANLEKLQDRKSRNVLRGSGDKR